MAQYATLLRPTAVANAGRADRSVCIDREIERALRSAASRDRRARDRERGSFARPAKPATSNGWRGILA
jgi:hypothetical protein